MEVDYSLFTSFVTQVCDSNNLSYFKHHSNFTDILEHVSRGQGAEYLHYIRTMTTITDEQVSVFAALNDSIGSPNKVTYGPMNLSPSNLRYVFHAHLILTHIQTLSKTEGVDIVEVGGGYGGLCLAVHKFASNYNVKINSYTIVDLPQIGRLQTLFLNKIEPALSVSIVDATTYGSMIPQTDLFLISNYCFSEITATNQAEYRKNLFPKVSHGFMAWNTIPVYDFGFPYRAEEEYPKTGTYNYYVRF